MEMQSLYPYRPPAEVPEDINLQEYDDFFPQQEYPQQPLYCSNLHKQVFGPDPIPILPKREILLPECETNLPQDYSGWYHNPMASSPYSQEANQPLSISQPPTPAAECQVSSTISPLNSPFTPGSEGSYSSMFHQQQPIPDPTHYEVQGPHEFTTLAEFGEYKGMTEEQLVSLTARDLNRLCRDMPEDLVKQLKKRRRTLKNRGYAYNSRVRRVTQKNVLETERDDLKKQLNQMAERCKLLEREADQWKRRAQSLQQSQIGNDL